MRFTRRQLLQAGLVAGTAPWWAANPLHGARPMPYSETLAEQNDLLARRLAEAEQYLVSLADAAEAERRRAWAVPPGTTAAGYEKRMRPLRERVKQVIGYPPPGRLLGAAPKLREVGQDEDGTFYKVSMPLLEGGLTAYGLLIRPAQAAPGKALAVAIHGGGGTPELAAELLGPTNYNNMGRRLARRGHVVWMPACMDRASFDPPGPGREDVHGLLDRRARLVGTTLTALDALAVIESTRAVLAAERLEQAIVLGLSYGGLRCLVAAALSDLFAACVSSCYFQDRRAFLEQYMASGGFGDWFFTDCFRVMTDVELAQLICPRPLFVELGTTDDRFPPGGAARSVEEVRAVYRQLGLGGRFGFDAFEGGHEFSGVRAFEFLDKLGL